MKKLYQYFIFLLITKPYLHLAISIGVILIWRIALIDVVYADHFEDAEEPIYENNFDQIMLDMTVHYDNTIFDINEIIQSSTTDLEVVEKCMCYVSAVIDPNILAKTEGETLDNYSKFSVYIESFGAHRPFVLSQSETIARDFFKASATIYNSFIVLNVFEHSSEMPALYQATPTLLKDTFDVTYDKISTRSMVKDLEIKRFRLRLLKESLVTIRNLNFPSSL